MVPLFAGPEQNFAIIQIIVSYHSIDPINTTGIHVGSPLLDEPSRLENSYHVVTARITDDTAILDGFTITAGNAYVPGTFSDGGGLYIDPVFPAYDVQALVGADPDAALNNPVNATIPPPSAIDYYGILEPNINKPIRTGDTVIFGFRAQAFVTRAYIVPVSGISKGTPAVEGIWGPDGRPAEWPGW